MSNGENSIVRYNLMNRDGYSPYCGGNPEKCSWPRTKFNGEQFVCRECGWKSSFEKEFIDKYKKRWGIK